MKSATNTKKTGFDAWQSYVNSATSQPKTWNQYDCEIQMAVYEYNSHLGMVTGYMPLDWRLIKAMMWVETGAGKPEWNSSPIQIGNPGDPGLAALLNGKEGGDLILPPRLKRSLTATAATIIPADNIRAGIGYLLMRMANFAVKSVPDSDSTIYEVIVNPGDSLERVARVQGSTVELLRHLNPGAYELRPGQTLKYRKGAVRKVIVGWKPITTNSIATYYNVGDPMYAQKLDYALSVMSKQKESACAP
jgi:hypothetical protein